MLLCLDHLGCFKPSSNIYLLLYVTITGGISWMTTLSFRKPTPSVFVYGSLSVNFNFSCSPLDSFQFVSTIFEECCSVWTNKPKSSVPSTVAHVASLSYAQEHAHWCPEKRLFFPATISGYWSLRADLHFSGLHSWQPGKLNCSLRARSTNFDSRYQTIPNTW